MFNPVGKGGCVRDLTIAALVSAISYQLSAISYQIFDTRVKFRLRRGELNADS